MKKYRLAVCKGPDCKQNGADKVFATARAELTRLGLTGHCDAYRGGCYGLCHLGPNVVIREDEGRKRDPLSREDFQLLGTPGEAYYSGMTPEKMERVVAGHLVQGKPVVELLGDPTQEEDLRLAPQAPSAKL